LEAARSHRLGLVPLVPPSDEAYWAARAEGHGSGYWDDRAMLDPLAAVIDPDGKGSKNEYVNELHRRALRRVPIGRTDGVLDFGCGTGRNLALLADSARHVVGVDISPKMLGVAAGVADGFGNCSVALMEEGRIPAPDEAFDAVVTVLVLQAYASDPEAFDRVAGELRRALRWSGRLILLERVEPRGALSTDSWSAMLARSGFALVSSSLVRTGTPSLLGRMLIRERLPMVSPIMATDAWANRHAVGTKPYVERLMVASKA
jgi:SAM-dependent methyltransferase